MNNKEAIAIIRKEYLCVDRDCDIERNCGKCDLMMPSKEPILEAYKMAIQALDQEPCGDAIDRKLVCAFIAGLISDDGEREKGLEYIRSMPPVNPQPCEDAISRQAAKRALEDRFMELQKRHDDKRYETNYCLNTILELPPVNPTKTGWIPVSERLPKENKEVLVTTVWGEVTIGERYSTIDYFINDGAINANEDEVIAWMPLPKPYEPQESEDKDADKKCTYKETGCGSCKRQLDCPIEADKAESEG